ncbi:MAG: hypothetical protein V5A20_00630 [Salinibacter sp.]|jgi:hypothetical protein|uniref:hypothetical protein n=1 Tax=Salinibacter sp. TaxID=2065818 RepID=UPI002FC29B3F
MPNPIKEALLNRGWAGQTLSRSETVDRINPLIHQHIELNHHYGAAVRYCDDARVVDVLERLQKTARTDVGKLSETVLSCGGTPYNGTDLSPEDFALEGSLGDLFGELHGLETAFNDALADELDLEHQMRTRGVLQAIKSNSEDRLTALKALQRRIGESA